jgi:hypothetical protein
MQKQLTATTLSVFVCFSTAFAANPRPPWDWTPAERAQARLDLGKRVERIRAYEGELRTSGMPPAYVQAAGDFIDGDSHPELFFVTELFEILVRSSFVTLPTAYPELIRQRSNDLFKDRAEWDQFATIVAEYADVLKEEQAAADVLNKMGVSAAQSRKCAAAARALREARRTFGRVRFDRTLYETVPAGMRTLFSIDTDFDKAIAMALKREEGCQ